MFDNNSKYYSFLPFELFENYFSKKIISFLKFSQKIGPIVGALFAIIPQCGFSVIASSLYSRRIITRGCLIAVYLATSDETIPILLAKPEKAYLIIPIVAVKLVVGLVAGYLIDKKTYSELVKTAIKLISNKQK